MDEQAADHERVGAMDDGPDQAIEGAALEPAPAEVEMSEAAAIPTSRPVPMQVVLSLCGLVLAALQGVGSFLAWLTYSLNGTSGSLKGIENWRGFGWITLILAVAIVVVIAADLVQPTVVLKAVTAALFGASGVVGVYYVLQYCAFPAYGQPSTSVGWGSGLVMGAGVLGLGIATASARLARPSPLTAD